MGNFNRLMLRHFLTSQAQEKKAEQMAITLENANRDLAATEAALKELNENLAISKC